MLTRRGFPAQGDSRIMKTYRLFHFLITAVATAACITPVAASAQTDTTTVRHIAGRIPVQGFSRELSADRPTYVGSRLTSTAVGPKANPWKLQATLPGAVIHDISFPTAKIGYAAAEAGQVWKTTDGGAHWKEVLNLSFPWYWYGVHAFNAKDVVISGFYDSSTFEGIIRWSHDGGATWTSDIVLTSTGWVQRVRFANRKDGLIMDLVNGTTNGAQYTTDGGAAAGDWTTVVSNPDGGWFLLEFSLLPNRHARASGINYCDSTDAGAVWTCGSSIDSVFDGETFFVNDKVGWVAGGEISPNVEGWVHRTTDGGKTWSGRTLDDPWPIREVRFVTPAIGWAAGGNIYSKVGGMYFSRNGGKTWSLDANTGAEMDACASKRVGPKFQVWCAGYNSALNGVVYTVKNVGAE
jgi:photosystem II stability/assembly factor-like uncharacterized protein